MTTGPAVQRLLDRLDAVRPAGTDKWIARCPCHDDKKPSLSVTQGDGAAVFYCHACQSNGTDVCDAVGLPAAALFDDWNESAGAGRKRRKPKPPAMRDALNAAADAGPETLDGAVRYLCDKALEGTEAPAGGNGSAANQPAVEAGPVELRTPLSADLPRREWLVDGFLQERDLAMVHAYRGIGKSRFTHGLIVSLAAAAPFLKFSSPRPRGVLLVDGELPREDLQAMLAQAVAASPSEPQAPVKILSADVAGAPVRSLATAAGRHQVERYLDGISLLVLDAITTLCPGAGPENDAESWESMQAWLLELRREGVTVLLVHHDGKGGVQRGTSKREDVLSQVVQLKHPSDYRPSEGARFELHFSKSRGLVGDRADPIEAWLRPGPDGADAWTWRALEDVQAATALRLKGEGLTQRDIAAELGVGVATVNRALKRGQERGT